MLLSYKCWRMKKKKYELEQNSLVSERDRVRLMSDQEFDKKLKDEEEKILAEFLDREKSLSVTVAENKRRVQEAKASKEEEKMKQFMEEEARNEEAILKLKEVITKRKDELSNKREEEEKKKNGSIHFRRKSCSRIFFKIKRTYK